MAGTNAVIDRLLSEMLYMVSLFTPHLKREIGYGEAEKDRGRQEIVIIHRGVLPRERLSMSKVYEWEIRNSLEGDEDTSDIR